MESERVIWNVVVFSICFDTMTSPEPSCPQLFSSRDPPEQSEHKRAMFKRKHSFVRCSGGQCGKLGKGRGTSPIAAKGGWHF